VPALFHDPALVAGALAAEPTVEQVMQSYRDLGALARFGWRPFLNTPKLERRLRRVSAPTRIIAAGEDRIVPRLHCERYAAAIPDAELVVVPDCGHALHGERPAEIAAAVTTFIAG
jgi:pimeloyl-ACP methyl ester carboxylesterase